VAFSHQQCLVERGREKWKPLISEAQESGKETPLFAPFLYLKCIILPRQARDKHRESSTQKMSGGVSLGKLLSMLLQEKREEVKALVRMRERSFWSVH
jgi:chaperone required for assembly of F1-ATPase